MINAHQKNVGVNFNNNVPINFGINANSSQINTYIINFNINVSQIPCRYSVGNEKLPVGYWVDLLEVRDVESWPCCGVGVRGI